MNNDQHKRLHSTMLDTPLGKMMAIANATHLFQLAFYDGPESELATASLVDTLHANIIPGSSRVLDLIACELEHYFHGQLRAFTTPLIYTGTAFQQRVWDELQKIPYGETYSYAQLAKAAGNAAACRAVAQANGRNRFAVIIPCHRVINSSGALGGYSAGVARKCWLLEHEKKNCKYGIERVKHEFT